MKTISALAKAQGDEFFVEVAVAEVAAHDAPPVAERVIERGVGSGSWPGRCNSHGFSIPHLVGGEGFFSGKTPVTSSVLGIEKPDTPSPAILKRGRKG